MLRVTPCYKVFQNSLDTFIKLTRAEVMSIESSMFQTSNLVPFSRWTKDMGCLRVYRLALAETEVDHMPEHQRATLRLTRCDCAI